MTSEGHKEHTMAEKQMFSTLVLFLTEHSNMASNYAYGTAASALSKTTQISLASFNDTEGMIMTNWLIKSWAVPSALSMVGHKAITSRSQKEIQFTGQQ